MYIPPHFQELDRREILSVIERFPLACIVAQTKAGLIANHVPLLATPAGDRLIGHVALANDIHRLVANGREVLTIFRGEQAYVSPNSYPGKAEHHRHVPTWNYEVVHVHGAIHFQHDMQAKRSAVGLLTHRQEKKVSGAQAWKMTDAPKDYLNDQLGEIVALRIEVGHVLAKAKLSQNRNLPDYLGVIEALQAQGQEGMAKRMTERKGHLPDEDREN